MRWCWPWGGDDPPSTSATNYFPALGYAGGGWNATETARLNYVSSAFTLDHLYVRLDTAPGSGKSYTFKVRKNSADTALTVTIADSATTGEITGTDVTFADGDTIAISCTPSGTPAAVTTAHGFVEGRSGSRSYPVIGGTNSNPSTSAANWLALYGSRGAWQTTEVVAQQVVPTAGAFRNLRVRYNPGGGTGPGTGKSYTYALVVNGVTSALTVTISDTGQAAIDSTHSVTVAAGDTVSLVCTPSGTPTAAVARFAVEFIPDADGESFFLYGNGTAVSTTATLYDSPVGTSAGFNATETLRQLPLPALTMTKVYLLLGTAPGSGKSRTFTIRKNAAASGLAVTVSDTATTGNTASSVTTAVGDRISLQSVPTGTPAALTNGAHVGVLVVYPVTAPGSMMPMFG